jgi:rhodanese-related sulfurtransferase
MQHSPEFIALCEAAKKCIREITSEDVAKKLGKTCLIDVRDESEYVAGHLPGAKHLSRGTIEIYIHKLANKDQEIILYCGGGNRSALAAESLKKMGYNNVLSMIGGYRTWAQENRQISRD